MNQKQQSDWKKMEKSVKYIPLQGDYYLLHKKDFQSFIFTQIQKAKKEVLAEKIKEFEEYTKEKER